VRRAGGRRNGAGSVTLTDTLLSFSRDTRFEVLPPAVVHEARRYVLDALGCALGGHAVEKGRIAAAYAARLAGAPEAGIVGSMARVSMPAAAFANAELVNALDHDSIPHVVPVTLPPVLAAGQATHARGKELVTAMVVAHEIGNRIGRASSAMIKSLMETGSTPEAFGINNEALIGGALGTSSLLGQSREQAAQALRVVRVIHDNPGAVILVAHHPSNIVRRVGTEGREDAGNRLRSNAKRCRCERRRRQIGDVVSRMTVHGQRHGCDAAKIGLYARVGQLQVSALDSTGGTATRAVLRQRRAERIQRKPTQRRAPAPA